MRNNLFESIGVTSFIAAAMLLLYWVGDKAPDVPLQGSPSGWWWFGLILLGVFFANLEND